MTGGDDPRERADGSGHICAKHRAQPHGRRPATTVGRHRHASPLPDRGRHRVERPDAGEAGRVQRHGHAARHDPHPGICYHNIYIIIFS